MENRKDSTAYYSLSNVNSTVLFIALAVSNGFTRRVGGRLVKYLVRGSWPRFLDDFKGCGGAGNVQTKTFGRTRIVYAVPIRNPVTGDILNISVFFSSV